MKALVSNSAFCSSKNTSLSIFIFCFILFKRFYTACPKKILKMSIANKRSVPLKTLLLYKCILHAAHPRDMRRWKRFLLLMAGMRANINQICCEQAGPIQRAAMIYKFNHNFSALPLKCDSQQLSDFIWVLEAFSYIIY
jgi:hypothetical protein